MSFKKVGTHLVQLLIVRILMIFFVISAAHADQIPIHIETGFGYGEYELFGASSDGSLTLQGGQIKLSGRVDQQTIQKYQSKIPEAYRRQALGLKSISVTKWWIPKTLFFTSGNNDLHAYGASWGLLPGLSQNIFGVRLGIYAGPIFHLIHLRNTQLDQTDFLARPGLRGEIQLSIPFVFLPARFTVGTFVDTFIPQTLFKDRAQARSSNSMRSHFVMLEVSIPLDVEMN